MTQKSVPSPAPDLNSYPHQTFWLRNRHGVKLFARFNGDPAQVRPLAVLAHGFSDVHDAPHMRVLADHFLQTGYHVLTYDATNSWGKSEGAMHNATFTNVYDDLSDVLSWAKSQPWYRRPLALAGHSLGGAAALMYAAKHQDEVSRLVLLNPVVAGSLLARRLPRAARAVWRLFGKVPDMKVRGKWYGYNLLKDGYSYDGQTLAPHITIPTLMITGMSDRLIPASQQSLLANCFKTNKLKWVLVEGANHTFSNHLDDLAKTLEREHVSSTHRS